MEFVKDFDGVFYQVTLERTGENFNGKIAGGENELPFVVAMPQDEWDAWQDKGMDLEAVADTAFGKYMDLLKENEQRPIEELAEPVIEAIMAEARRQTAQT